MENLTPRQREVMTEVCNGNSAKEIARHLGVGFRTVETHLYNARQRLNAKNSCHAVALFLKVAAVLLLFVTTGYAEWDGVKGPNSGWYEAQELNPEARVRLGVSWKSCCAHSDVVKTRFRVDRDTAEDVWFYLDGNTWRKVDPDIIHWNDPTPDGQPVLFVYSGTPTCFYPGDTGG